LLLLLIIQKLLALDWHLLSFLSGSTSLLDHVDLLRWRLFLGHGVVEVKEPKTSRFLHLWLTSLRFLGINLVHFVLNDLSKGCLSLALHLLGCFAWLF